MAQKFGRIRVSYGDACGIIYIPQKSCKNAQKAVDAKASERGLGVGEASGSGNIGEDDGDGDEDLAESSEEKSKKKPMELGVTIFILTSCILGHFNRV